MIDDSQSDLERRKQLTFEQAEGTEPLPTQLKLGEVSPLLRSAIWAAIYEDLMRSQDRGDLLGFWEEATYDWHVYRKHRPADDYTPKSVAWVEHFKGIILTGTYAEVFGLLQWLLRFRGRGGLHLSQPISWALITGRAAYRVVDQDTIMPIGSHAELETVQRAFADLEATEFHGARQHLRRAAEELSAGKFPDSIRESIHSVESVVRLLEPDGNFRKALAKLESKANIHNALKNGFGSIYAFTSDENGIRHPLLQNPDAKVDETDALFMFGACAAFVSYLINKARGIGLLG